MFYHMERIKEESETILQVCLILSFIRQNHDSLELEAKLIPKLDLLKSCPVIFVIYYFQSQRYSHLFQKDNL